MRITELKAFENLSKDTHLVIYGASSGGQKVAETLKSFDVKVDYFVDGNEKTWGTTVLGKKVYAPEHVASDECRIVIASDAHFTEIRNGLEKFGKKNACIFREDIIFPFVKEIAKDFEKAKIKVNSKKSVFIEFLEGYQRGGVEQWSYMVAKGLQNKGLHTKLLARYIENTPLDWNDILVTDFSGEYIDYKKCVKELVEYIGNHLPCTLIVNKQQQLLYAGYISKQLYPNQVNIISVIHSDLEINYIRQQYFEEVIDKFICVSKKIQSTLFENYNISKEKIYYMGSPVVLEMDDTPRTYTVDREKPIRIAYGARLEKVQKRADLLIVLIKELEKRKVNYYFEIAGTGTCYPLIKQFIDEEGLSKKVRMVGNLEHKDMGDFWKRADIFVNVSESEGTPISMLEAMSCGAVPFVFDISGSRDFVEDEKNGFVFFVGRCDVMADTIADLEKFREKLVLIGQMSMKTAREKCNYDDYLDGLIKLVN